MKFSDLLRYQDHARHGSSGPEEAQRDAVRRFPEVIREHGLALADPLRPPEPSGRRVLIGVAVGYAIRDLELLDDIAAELNLRVEDNVGIVDISVPDGGHYLEALVPGSTATAQTPIVVVWESGRVVRTEVGKVARDFLRARYLGRP